MEKESDVGGGGWVGDQCRMGGLGFGSLGFRFAARVHVWLRGRVVLYVVACLSDR